MRLKMFTGNIERVGFRRGNSWSSWTKCWSIRLVLGDLYKLPWWRLLKHRHGLIWLLFFICLIVKEYCFSWTFMDTLTPLQCCEISKPLWRVDFILILHDICNCTQNLVFGCWFHKIKKTCYHRIYLAIYIFSC